MFFFREQSSILYSLFFYLNQYNTNQRHILCKLLFFYVFQMFPICILHASKNSRAERELFMSKYDVNISFLNKIAKIYSVVLDFYASMRRARLHF